MVSLEVELGERSYPILIGTGLLGDRELMERHVAGRDLLLVSNTVVAPLHAERLKSALAGRRLVEAILPDGESHKTLATVS
ncbi:MAG: 3-dehydroquinate synthase, partial [Steroidobacteraceae bacterium]